MTAAIEKTPVVVPLGNDSAWSLVRWTKGLSTSSAQTVAAAGATSTNARARRHRSQAQARASTITMIVSA
jgi:hypothetical protein